MSSSIPSSPAHATLSCRPNSVRYQSCSSLSSAASPSPCSRPGAGLGWLGWARIHGRRETGTNARLLKRDNISAGRGVSQEPQSWVRPRVCCSTHAPPGTTAGRGLRCALRCTALTLFLLFLLFLAASRLLQSHTHRGRSHRGHSHRAHPKFPSPLSHGPHTSWQAS